MKLPVYLGMLREAERVAAASFRTVADGHGDEPDVFGICHTLASQCDAHVAALDPIVDRFGEQPDDEPDRLHAEALPGVRTGPLGLLRDLQDLYLIVTLVDITWTMVDQAAAALRDGEMRAAVDRCSTQTDTQIAWLSTRMKQAAPQALIVAD